jgi:hypothetical protein
MWVWKKSEIGQTMTRKMIRIFRMNALVKLQEQVVFRIKAPYVNFLGNVIQ